VLRATLVRWVLLPALLIATAFLAWWTYRTTLGLQRRDRANIIDLTQRLNRAQVVRVDQLIIAGDNAVAHMVNPDDLDVLATRWVDAAERISPTVRSVMVLDEGRRVLRHVSRGGATAAGHFEALFVEHILPQLYLDGEAPGSHKHRHETINGDAVVVSYLTREVEGRRYFIVLEVDLDYIRTAVLPHLFDEPSMRGRFNVVDEDRRLVFGKVLRGGDFVVSRPFPTTLYRWQLSVAARDAPELQEAERRRRVLESALVLLSLAILVAGVAFLAYAARSEQKLSHLKSDFISTVSHELKTPLSLIRMFGEMLATERVATESKRRQYLDIIVRESERLTALIENVLDFAKLERGKAAYEFARGDLGDVVARGVEVFRYRLDRERPVLALERDADVPATRLDERAIQLLLFNLLDNAIKYAPDGDAITVRVRARAGELVLEVEDDGPGIDDDDARRIFERFYRGKNARRAGGARGSGIGLALVKHIATAHGGDAVVVRGTSGGACFRVTLPVRDA
jgi:two-component system phosphate regulon sensor histidine kinase PhoR